MNKQITNKSQQNKYKNIIINRLSNNHSTSTNKKNKSNIHTLKT